MYTINWSNHYNNPKNNLKERRIKRKIFYLKKSKEVIMNLIFFLSLFLYSNILIILILLINNISIHIIIL